MKLTLLAIALALPCLTQAAYTIKMPLENAQGGALENGSIVFNKPATTPTNPSEPEQPTEPSEPAPVDPFEPENPACDPLAQGYPGNSTGKERIWYSGFKNEEGLTYIGCKLKDEPEDKLLARFVGGYNLASDACNIDNPNNILYTSQCRISMSHFEFKFRVVKNDSGYEFPIIETRTYMPSGATFTFDQIGKIEFDGVECANPRIVVEKPFGYINNVCDYPLSHDEMMKKYYKPFIVKIYSK